MLNAPSKGTAKANAPLTAEWGEFKRLARWLTSHETVREQLKQSGAFRSLVIFNFPFSFSYKNGGNPTFFEDSSPRKRLEPLNHTEMRAFLWAFGKTTSPMLLL